MIASYWTPSSMWTEAKRTLYFGAPVIATQLLQMSMSFVDTVMAGRISALDLGAIAVGASSFLPLMVISMGTLIVVNPIVAHNLGARKFHLIGKNLRQALWLSQLFALVSFFIIRNLDFVMQWMNVEAEIIPLAMGYLKAISWGVFPLYAYVCYRSFNEGLSNVRPAMFIALAGALINIPANYALMFGFGPVPGLGAIGTGYASAIVYTAMWLGMMIFTGAIKPYKRFAIFSTFRLPDPKSIKEMLSLGVPIGVSGSLEVTMFALVSLMMGTLGTIAVASHQVAINFASLTFMIPFGLSIAQTARIGQSMGRGQVREARFRGWMGVVVSTSCMAVFAMIMLLFPEWIIAIYTDDPDVVEGALKLLGIAAIFQLSDGVQISAIGALRGMKDTQIPMVFNLIAYGLTGIPLSIYLGITLGYGGQGMWTGLVIGLTVAAIVHVTRFHHLTMSTIRKKDASMA